jgi:hypothetical protein
MSFRVFFARNPRDLHPSTTMDCKQTPAPVHQIIAPARVIPSGLCEESPGPPSFNHNGLQTDLGSCPSDHRPVKFAPEGFLVAKYAPRNDMIATPTCKQTLAPVHQIIAWSNSRPGDFSSHSTLLEMTLCPKGNDMVCAPLPRVSFRVFFARNPRSLHHSTTMACKQTPAPVHPIIALSNSRPGDFSSHSTLLEMALCPKGNDMVCGSLPRVSFRHAPRLRGWRSLRGIPGTSILQPRRSDLDLSPRPFPKGKGSRSLNGLSPSLQGRAALRRRGVGVGLAHSRIRVPVLWVFADGAPPFKTGPLTGTGQYRKQKTENRNSKT